MQMASWWFGEDAVVKEMKKKIREIELENEALRERVLALEEKLKSIEIEQEIKKRVDETVEEKLANNKRGHEDRDGYGGGSSSKQSRSR